MKRLVYALQDPRDFVIRYIGMSSNPKTRLKEHCSLKSAGNGNKSKLDWIQDLKNNNLKPSLIILEDASSHIDPCSREDFFMNAYKSTIFNTQSSSTGNFQPVTKRETYQSREEYLKNKCKVIEVISENGIITTYPSIVETGKALNIKPKRIAEQLKGYKSVGHGVTKKVYSYRGLVFKYKN